MSDSTLILNFCPSDEVWIIRNDKNEKYAIHRTTFESYQRLLADLGVATDRYEEDLKQILKNSKIKEKRIVSAFDLLKIGKKMS